MAVSSLTQSSPSPRLGGTWRASARTRRKVKPAPVIHRRGVVDREQVPVAPDGAGTGLDALPADRRRDPLVVVGHLQRPEAVIADVQRLGGKALLIFHDNAVPSDEIDHRSSSSVGHWTPGAPHWLPRCVDGPVPQIALDDDCHVRRSERPGRSPQRRPGRKCVNMAAWTRGAWPTFHHGDFSTGAVLEAKARTGRTVSVCIPARDEGSTVGSKKKPARSPTSTWAGGQRLVDEVIVLDDGVAADDHYPPEQARHRPEAIVVAGPGGAKAARARP